MGRPKINPDTIEKTCPTCKLQFVIEYRLRNRRTYCSKKCSGNNPEVIKKIVESQAKTFTEKYGMHPMKTNATKEKLKESVMKKHGVEWISKKDGWYDTIKENNLIKYGIEHYNNVDKRKQTCIEKYGVDNPTKSPEILNSIIKTKHNFHYDYLKQLYLTNNITLLFNKEDYDGYHFTKKYKFQCIKCNYIFESSVYNLEKIFCEKCDPDRKDTLENSFFEFLSSLSPATIIKRHDRSILYGKELDFYLPEKKIAFEINGLYWHSENGNGIYKNYHLNKTKGCFAHGIRLIHIFENEWRDKSDILKSVIKTILNCNNTKIFYARKCKIKEVSPADKNTFLNNNHLQKEDKSSIKLGLYLNEDLISIMTFNKKSRFDSSVEWELSRFCNLKDTIVVGGASKLFSYFINTYHPKSIVSYSDRRFFSGEIYKILNFQFVKNTQPSYHYISPDYKNTFNRMNFQKHLLHKKLQLFDCNLTEWENMKNNGWDRIWDCGNSKWIWKPN